MTARDFGPEVDGNPAPPAERADRATSFAVVVGIDRYPGFGDLAGACNDARAFHEWVVDPAGGGVPPSNARLRVSGKARSLRGAKPLKREVDRDLDEFVSAARATRAPSRLYLFFAGHGMAPLQSTAAGVMANAVPARCWNLSFTTYLTWFERCRDFSEVVLLSDCCRTPADGPAGAPQHEVCAAGPHQRQATLVAHATDMGQRAFEDHTREGFVRGFFTAALLEGLRGAAADPASGEVHATSLAAFLDVEVRRRSGERQYPATATTFPPLVLGPPRPAPPPAALPVTVVAPDGASRQVSIVDGALAEVHVETTTGGTFTLSLPRGLYEVRDPVAAAPRGFRVDREPVPIVDLRSPSGGA